jgi:hypothetical protein
MNKQILVSWLKVFLSSTLTLVVVAGDIWHLDFKQLLSASIVSTLPVIINFLNPNDTRYGKGSKTPNNE